MKKTSIFFFNLLLAFAVCMISVNVHAQGVTLPPSGGNQKASISQWVGLVKITVDYSSPDVTGPQGQDRKGQIWGQLVPYGMAPNTFGSAKEIPWRAGANESTTFTVSHDVKVQGKNLKAGTYSLHLIPQESRPWTLIFNNNSTAWGSFFYDEADDALRVEVTPEDAPYREWLAYDFKDRKANSVVCALEWEEKRIPFTIEASNLNDLYVENMERELQSSAGFTWQGWQSAANFCLTNNTHLEKGLEWAEASITAPFIGQANFQTLQTKALLAYALGKDELGKETSLAAMEHDAPPFQYYQLGASLIGQNKNEEAFDLFKLMAKKLPDNWMTYAGLAAGNRVTGNTKEAIKYYKMALEGAPAQWKPSLQQRLDSLESPK